MAAYGILHAGLSSQLRAESLGTGKRRTGQLSKVFLVIYEA